jgi:hypothetical protein
VAKSIAQYTAEVSKSYDNSRKALQNQIDAISGNLEQTQKQINENYANQQNTLNNQRNQAASAASMQAAGSGGSFGGAANIANKKYYEQTFVPAQTQLNTNKSQALENAQSQANSNRLSLESQMAQMQDEISRLGLQRYYDVLAQERQEKLAKQQLAAQNSISKYLSGATANSNPYSARSDESGYTFYNNKTGNNVKFGTYVSGLGGNFSQNALSNIQKLASDGDANALAVLNILKYNPNKKLVQNTGKNYVANNYKFLSKRDNDALNILGLKLG